MDITKITRNRERRGFVFMGKYSFCRRKSSPHYTPSIWLANVPEIMSTTAMSQWQCGVPKVKYLSLKHF